MKNSTALLLVLISAGLYFTFIGPEYTEVSALRAEQSQYQEILANVSEVSTKRTELQTKYKNIPQAELDRISKILPDQVDTVNLARDFDTIASRYGIPIKSFGVTVENTSNIVALDLGTASAGPSVQNVTIQLAFVATYDNFRRFLRDIESSIRVADINSLTFQATDNGLMNFNLSLKTYWLK